MLCKWSSQLWFHKVQGTELFFPGILSKYGCWLWGHNLVFWSWAAWRKCWKDCMICEMKSSHLWNQKENLCQKLKMKNRLRFSFFGGFDCSFTWVKYVYSMWKSTYLYHVTNQKQCSKWNVWQGYETQ